MEKPTIQQYLYHTDNRMNYPLSCKVTVHGNKNFPYHNMPAASCGYTNIDSYMKQCAWYNIIHTPQDHSTDLVYTGTGNIHRPHYKLQTSQLHSGLHYYKVLSQLVTQWPGLS